MPSAPRLRGEPDLAPHRRGTARTSRSSTRRARCSPRPCSSGRRAACRGGARARRAAARSSALPRSANPALITTSPCTPFVRALARRPPATDAAGTMTTARSTSSGTSRTVGYARTLATVAGVRVHRVDRSGEVAGEQVAEHLVADRPRPAARADHRDRAGREQPADRPGLRDLLPLVLHRLRRLGRIDRERDVHDAVGELTGDLVAGVAEHTEHARGCPAASRRRTCRCRGVRGDRGEVLEHDRGEPASLLVVLHGERDLGLVAPGVRS